MQFLLWSLIPYCARSWCSYNCWVVTQTPSCERNWAKWAKITTCNLQPRLQVTVQATASLQPSPRIEGPWEDIIFHFELRPLLPFLKVFKSIKCLLAIWRFLHEICNVYSEFACFSIYHMLFLFTKLAIYETIPHILLNCFFQKAVLSWLVQFDLLLRYLY